MATTEHGLGTLHVKLATSTYAVPTHTLLRYSDGFSFGVASERDALLAAYLYRHSKFTRIDHTPTGWRVSIYRNAQTDGAKS